MTVREALGSAMEEEMRRDDAVFLMGALRGRCPRHCAAPPAPIWLRRMDRIANAGSRACRRGGRCVQRCLQGVEGPVRQAWPQARRRYAHHGDGLRRPRRGAYPAALGKYVRGRWFELLGLRAGRCPGWPQAYLRVHDMELLHAGMPAQRTAPCVSSVAREPWIACSPRLHLPHSAQRDRALLS
jgi:hypothetical protein